MTTFSGGGAKDKIKGGSGGDLLDGGAGKDALNGGTGGDTVLYSDKTDRLTLTLDGSHKSVVKVGGAREDTLKNIENVYGSQGRNNITGDDRDNVLVGGAHRDTLDGRGGKDILVGSLGSDSMTGGRGRDKFLFSDAPVPNSIDKITDFRSGVDLLDLSQVAFSILPAGTLPAAYYRSGSRAVDADDFIIYNPANGKLLYDDDGAGGDAAVQFARLSPGLTANHNDFFVV